jgi:hypothetical protein
MRIKLLFLLGLGFHGFTLANSGYEVLVTVRDAKSELVFPAFEVSKTNKSGTSQVGGCTYFGELTAQGDASLLLEGQMSCVHENGDSSMDMPIFVLRPEGGLASMVLDDGTETWKYSVEVKVMP